MNTIILYIFTLFSSEFTAAAFTSSLGLNGYRPRPHGHKHHRRHGRHFRHHRHLPKLKCITESSSSSSSCNKFGIFACRKVRHESSCDYERRPFRHHRRHERFDCKPVGPFVRSVIGSSL